MSAPLKPCSSCAGTGEDFSVCPECNGIGFEYFGCCVDACSLCKGEIVWWTTCDACKGDGTQIRADLELFAKAASLPSQRARKAD